MTQRKGQGHAPLPNRASVQQQQQRGKHQGLAPGQGPAQRQGFGEQEVEEGEEKVPVVTDSNADDYNGNGDDGNGYNGYNGNSNDEDDAIFGSDLNSPRPPDSPRSINVLSDEGPEEEGEQEDGGQEEGGQEDGREEGDDRGYLAAEEAAAAIVTSYSQSHSHPQSKSQSHSQSHSQSQSKSQYHDRQVPDNSNHATTTTPTSPLFLSLSDLPNNSSALPLQRLGFATGLMGFPIKAAMEQRWVGNATETSEYRLSCMDHTIITILSPYGRHITTLHHPHM